MSNMTDWTFADPTYVPVLNESKVDFCTYDYE